MANSPKKPSDGTGVSASDTPKYQHTVPETKPAFNLSPGKASELSHSLPSPSQIKSTAHVSSTHNDAAGNTDDSVLPKNVSPTTNLRVESNGDTNNMFSSPAGLALPKKDDKKKTRVRVKQILKMAKHPTPQDRMHNNNQTQIKCKMSFFPQVSMLGRRRLF
ncbi:Taf4p [Saccharomyces cerevisiae CEN.PK113-7D]|uniref:Taf4p n=1 Tax=Saccharomyces cerevisiae (strain CEN.PK113-7D) TaxID=889517 RepID=N1NY60_YEASC|nr:Taf4p [Saccharomyces cerevisiae CEN.PK113-7D]